MKLVGWMTAACVVSAAIAVAAAESSVGPEIAFGMLGPLLVADASWMLTERTYSRQPEQLTALLIKAFGFKVVFFGAYIVVMLTVLSLRPVPFVISFTSYFIALHLTEAFTMRRLFTGSDPGQVQTGVRPR